MNKFLFFLGITGMLFLIQCKSKESYAEAGTAVLEGKITTPTGPSFVIEVDGETKEIPLKQDGTFSANLDIPSAGIYKILFGPQGMFLPVYLQPGKTTGFQADASNFIMSAKYEGDTKVENEFLVAKMINEPTLLQIDQTTLFTLPEQDFLKQAEEIKTKLIDFKKEFQKQNGVFNEYFEEIINQDITFQVTNLKMYYPVYYNFLMKTNDFSPSENFYSFFQSIDINNEINLNSDHFKVFVPLYIEHLVKEKQKETENYEANGMNQLSVLGEVVTNPKIKETVSFQIMKQSFESKLGEAFAMYDVYMKQSVDENKKKTIENLYNQWLPLKPGNPAPAFSGKDKNGKQYTNEALKGKVLYVDVWATWCGPCLAELPHLESLQEKFKPSDNIVFMSVSIDQNEEPWRKMLEDKKMKGLQVFAPGAWNAEIITNYKIQGIPRFIIIDKEGKMVDGNAPRPSNPATYDILSKLI